MIVAHAEETGEIEEEEREMLYKVFDFADKEVADVMVPRPEVVALSIDLPPEECLAAAMEAPYTRYPVYRDSLDTVIGILHIRDLMREGNAQRRLRARSTWRRCCGRRTWCPRRRTSRRCSTTSGARRSTWPSSSTSTARREGIVTLEDLLEEIVGEIEDEFDLPDESVEKLADGRIRISGTFSVDDFNEQFDRAATRSTTTTRWRASSSASSAALPSPATRWRTTARTSPWSTSRARASSASRSSSRVGRSRFGRERGLTVSRALRRARCARRAAPGPRVTSSTRSRGSSSSGRSALRTAGWPPLPTQPGRADPQRVPEQDVSRHERAMQRQQVDELRRRVRTHAPRRCPATGLPAERSSAPSRCGAPRASRSAPAPTRRRRSAWRAPSRCGRASRRSGRCEPGSPRAPRRRRGTRGTARSLPAARAGRRGRSRRPPRGTRSRRPSSTPRGRQSSARARARSCGRPSA